MIRNKKPNCLDVKHKEGEKSVKEKIEAGSEGDKDVGWSSPPPARPSEES